MPPVTDEEILAARARKLAQPIPRQKNSKMRLDQILSFRIGTVPCAISAAYVRDIMPLSQFSRTPGATTSPYLFGLTNHRGEVLALIDLAALITTQASGGDFSYYLVLGTNTDEFGLVVHAVDAFLRHDQTDVKPLPATMSASCRSWTLGFTSTTDLLLFDGSALLAEPCFWQLSDSGGMAGRLAFGDVQL